MREEICGNLMKPHMETYIAVRRTWMSHLSLLVMHVMRLRSKLFSRVIFNYSNTSKMSPTATHPTLPREHCSGPQLYPNYLLLMQHFSTRPLCDMWIYCIWYHGLWGIKKKIRRQLRWETIQWEKWTTIPGQLTNEFRIASNRITDRPRKWKGNKRQKDLILPLYLPF